MSEDYSDNDKSLKEELKKANLKIKGLESEINNYADLQKKKIDKSFLEKTINTKILIVDDNPDMLEASAKIVFKAGYKILKAKNGKECLEMIDEFVPDLILLDVDLPDINGIEICKIIKNNPEKYGIIFIILISASLVSSDVQAEGLESGADNYIARPVPNRELLARVESMIRIKNTEEALRQSKEETRVLTLDNENLHKIVIESEQWFKFLAESIPQIVWTANPDGYIDYFSKNWYEYSGMTYEQTKNNGWDPIVHPDDLQKSSEKWKESISSGEVHEIEFRLKKSSDESYRWYLGRAVPFRDENGQIIKWFGTCTDIHNQIETQNRIQNLLDLEKKSRQELEYHRNELERSNSDLENFAYIASHDLQEPLRMVTSYTQILAKRYKGKLDEDADEFINFAIDGAVRMKALINDLLNYSRVARIELKFKPVNLNSIIDEVMKNLHLAVEENHTKVLYGDFPTVNADPTQMKQLFQNLISNAIKFSNNENPVVEISFERKDDNWLFRISDNGIGIEDNNLERIFLIFKRLHTKEEYPGTGIGLALCKKIISRHRGDLWVESELGTGSTFYFTLPV